MKKSTFVAVLGLAAGLVVSGSVRAEERTWAWSPLGIGIAAPLQLPFMDSDVYGLRMDGFLGYNASVYGLDWGIANLTTEDFKGLQLAALSWTKGSVYGVQFAAFGNVVGGRARALQAGLVNVVWEDTCGLQFGGILNYNVEFRGLQFAGPVNWNVAPSSGAQFALVNVDRDAFVGLSAGLVNCATQYTGFQLGLFNSADEITGYQLGLMNACNKMRGVQIGLVNIIAEGPLPVMVLANASF